MPEFGWLLTRSECGGRVRVTIYKGIYNNYPILTVPYNYPQKHHIVILTPAAVFVAVKKTAALRCVFRDKKRARTNTNNYFLCI